MPKRAVVGTLSVMLVVFFVAVAQQAGGGEEGTEAGAALFEQGQLLYEANCATCHQAGGGGAPPTFPALKGNDRLEDLELIVGNIHQGEGAMPAFPDLGADQIAALATYVRNAWGNEFGSVTSEQVAAILEGLEETGTRVSIWDGVSTETQVERGKNVFMTECAQCHGPRGRGAGQPEMPQAPAVAGGGFLRDWEGQTVATLYEFVQTTMPPYFPGSLSNQEYIDAIAYIFQLSNVPAGEEELVPDPEVLSNIVIEPQPEED